MNHILAKRINLPFILITLLIVALSATSCALFYNVFHFELRPVDNNHILLGSSTIIIALTLLFSLLALSKSLSKEVTETKFELRQICRDNKFFRLLSEKSNDMIHLNNAQGVIEYANPITFDLLGFEADEMIGKPADEFIHPEDRQTIREDMGQLVQGLVKDAPPREIRLLKKNGAYLDVEVKGFLLNDDGGQIHMGAILRNIANRKKRELLQQAKKEWELAFDTMTELVSVHDKNFRVIKVNNALCEFIGKTREEVIGAHCYHLLHNTDEPHINCPHQKAFESGHPITEIIHDHTKGDIPLRITCSPFYDEDGTFQGTVHIVKIQEIDRKQDHEHTLSICASCKDVRSSDNEWSNIEHFILDKFGTQFTHSICEKCREKLYPEFIKD